MRDKTTEETSISDEMQGLLSDDVPEEDTKKLKEVDAVNDKGMKLDAEKQLSTVEKQLKERQEIKVLLEDFVKSTEYLRSLQFQVFFINDTKLVGVGQYRGTNIVAKFYSRNHWFASALLVNLMKKDEKLNKFFTFRD